MKSVSLLAIVALLCSTGCATRAPAATGATVRHILASQIVPPAPRGPEVGVDGVAAVAAQANYQRSYVTPTSQSDSSPFSKR